MAVSCVLWDNDGVLVDTEVLYFEASRDVLRAVGFELTLAQFVSVSLIAGRSVFDLVAAEVSASRIEELRTRRNLVYADRITDSVPINDGVVDCLRALHGNIGMGIVTGSRRDHFEIMHERSGLLPFFDFVLTQEDYARSKPDPEPYLTAVNRYGLDAGTCLVVEDSERGLCSALAAGLRCVVVPGHMTRGGRFPGALAVLESVRELPVILARL